MPPTAFSSEAINYKAMSYTNLSKAQKLAKVVVDDGIMELTEDVVDIGVLAFTLLNGIEKTPQRDPTCQSAASYHSMTGQSVAQQAVEAF